MVIDINSCKNWKSKEKKNNIESLPKNGKSYFLSEPVDNITESLFISTINKY